MQHIGADRLIRAEHVLRALELQTALGNAQDRGLEEQLVFKRDQLRRAGLARPGVEHIIVAGHIAAEVDLRAGIRVQIRQPDARVEAGRVGELAFVHAGVEDLGALLDAQDERLLVILIPDAQQLDGLHSAVGVQIGLAAADDLGPHGREAVERHAVIGNLRRDGILRGQLDGGERLIDRFLRLRLGGLHGRGCVGFGCGLLGGDDADRDGQDLGRVARGDVAEIGDVHLQLRRQLRHGDGPAVSAHGDETVRQPDRDG